jgi:flagellar biosynthetic protein FliR
VETAQLLHLALPAEAYRLLLVVCRVSAALLMLPGYGDGGTPVRMRLMAALGIALCVAPNLPAMPPPNTWSMLAGIVAESVIGFIFGLLGRIIMSTAQIAGQLIGQSIGVSNVFTVGIGPDSSATLGAAVQTGCIAALFATGLHLRALQAVAESYAEFPPGTLPAFDATSRLMTQTVADSFRLAFQLSLPFLLLAVLFNIALAGINRALPMVPVFMIGAPALVLAGLHLMAATMPTLLGEMLGAQAAVLVR